MSDQSAREELSDTDLEIDQANEDLEDTRSKLSVDEKSLMMLKEKCASAGAMDTSRKVILGELLEDTTASLSADAGFLMILHEKCAYADTEW